MVGDIQGHPIIDLRRIPRERWREELLPLHTEARYQSLRTAGLYPTHDAVIELWLDLEDADTERLRRMQAAMHHPPAPEAGPRWRQLSMRLTPREHLELSAAAATLGRKPAGLARELVRNGIARLVYEQRRVVPPGDGDS